MQMQIYLNLKTESSQTDSVRKLGELILKTACFEVSPCSATSKRGTGLNFLHGLFEMPDQPVKDKPVHLSSAGNSLSFIQTSIA